MLIQSFFDILFVLQDFLFTFAKRNEKTMKHTYIFKILFSLFLVFIHPNFALAQTELSCNSHYDFIDKNDSITELRISINGHNATEEFFKEIDKEQIPLPTFKGKYKDCMIFMRGYGQHYRLLITFQMKDGKIHREDYEHSMCLKTSHKESYLFFYGEQPMKMTSNNWTDKIKFRKLRKAKKYYELKGRTIESCNNSIGGL